MSTSNTSPAGNRRLLIRGMWPFKGMALLSFLLLTCHQIGELLVPMTIGWIVDAISHRITPWQFLGALIVLGVVFLFLSLSFRLGARAGMRAAQSVEHRLRMQVAKHALLTGPAGHTPGEVLSIASSDTARQGMFVRLLGRGIAAVGIICFAAWNLFTDSWVLALVVLIGAPLLLVVLAWLSRRLEAHSAAEQQAAASTASLATDYLRGLRVLRGIGAVTTASSRYREQSQTAKGHAISASASLAGLDGLTIGANGIYLTVIALIGGNIALQGHMSVGSLVAGLGVAQLLLEPLQSLAQLPGQAARARASARRIHHYLAETPTLTEPGQQQADDAATHLPQLPTTGLVGVVSGEAARGQASTALVAELQRRYPQALAEPHRTVLFSGSLAENLNLANAGEGLEDCAAPSAELVQATALDDVLQSLPDGADSSIGDDGSLLSGGQRQRVALARALTAGTGTLILDNPTSALDSVTESDVANGVARYRQGKLTVIIAVSPAVLAACSVVYSHLDGAWRAGLHSELLASPGYRQAVTM